MNAPVFIAVMGICVTVAILLGWGIQWFVVGGVAR